MSNLIEIFSVVLGIKHVGGRPPHNALRAKNAYTVDTRTVLKLLP